MNMKTTRSLFAQRWEAFQNIKRGWYSLTLLLLCYGLSFFSLLTMGPNARVPIYPYGPNQHLFETLEGYPPTAPDCSHLLGTDNRGRDVLARIIHAFRIAVSFALIVTLGSYLLGIFVGALLGYFGGRLDFLSMRGIEVISLIPFFYMAMILASFWKPSFMLLSLILILLGGWIPITYYVRAEFLREKNCSYVLAARSMGLSHLAIIFRHILPNALTPIITFAPFAMVANISVLVALDFLGFGLPPPTPSWGELLQQGLEHISAWWLIVFPLLALSLTLLAITFIGEAIREAFDPKPHTKLP